MGLIFGPNVYKHGNFLSLKHRNDDVQFSRVIPNTSKSKWDSFKMRFMT